MQIGAILGQTAYDAPRWQVNGTGSQMSVGLYQSVAISANAAPVTLSFALHVETKETSTGLPATLCSANPQQFRSYSQNPGNLQ